MGLLYVCGMRKPDIAYAYNTSYGPVRRRIEALYQPLGIDGHGAKTGKHLLGLAFIRAGYLDVMYTLMRLINSDRHAEAVKIVGLVRLRADD